MNKIKELIFTKNLMNIEIKTKINLIKKKLEEKKIKKKLLLFSVHILLSLQF